MKRIIITLLTGLAALLLLSIFGCEGNPGGRGVTGDQGDQGNPYTAPVPDNRFFSLAIGNNSLTTHNGAPKVYLAFDTLHQNAGDTVVCQRLINGAAPIIDGVDGGASEWGAKYSDINLRKMAGYDNGIESARIRAAFDENFVYFQVKYTEVDVPQFGVTAAATLDTRRWIHGQDSVRIGNPPDTSWVYNPLNIPIWKVINADQDQDRVMFMFEITPMFWFDHDGCLVTCHESPVKLVQNQWVADMPGTYFHSTLLPKPRLDLWSWSSISSNVTGHADDKYMSYKTQKKTDGYDDRYTDGVIADLGNGPEIPNEDYVWALSGGAIVVSYNRPKYQSANDPNSSAAYPLWDWQIAKPNSDGWDSLATVPWFVTTMPSGSRADVMAKGQFENGTWTVEFKRARFTGNGDDTRF